MENREVVDQNTVMAATEGGVLEKGIQCYNQTIEATLQDAIVKLPEKLTGQWKAALGAKVTEAAHVVRKHGMTLSGQELIR